VEFESYGLIPRWPLLLEGFVAAYLMFQSCGKVYLSLSCQSHIVLPHYVNLLACQPPHLQVEYQMTDLALLCRFLPLDRKQYWEMLQAFAGPQWQLK
jgi:hypothetical protein